MIPLCGCEGEEREIGNGAGAFGAEAEIAGDNMQKNRVELKAK